MSKQTPFREKRISASGRRRIERLAVLYAKHNHDREAVGSWLRRYVPDVKGEHRVSTDQ